MITTMIRTMIAAISPTLTGWGLAGWGSAVWGGVFNHLWQSTAFAAVAALLALGLRKNHARARYWLWLAASCKFLVPFSMLVALGTSIGSEVASTIEKLWPSAPAIVAQPEMAIMIDEISQPFTQVSIPAAASEHHSMVPEILFGLWACGCAIVLVSWFRRWLRVRAAVRSANPIHLEVAVQPGFPHPDGWGWSSRQADGKKPQANAWGWSRSREAKSAAPTERGGIGIMSSPALIEPGIFGIFRPVLLLPEGIADRLTPAQLRSILAHELCHVKRRDNLAAAIHMIVEAAFWFHPLVWWIGARLVEERERACDEEVLLRGSEPGVYAESILQVCKFYLESPLKCVAGVTGSDLKKRIESIMSGLPGRSLTPARKLVLIAASLGAIAGPVLVGVLTSSRIHAQPRDSATSKKDQSLSFEVASIKRSDPAHVGFQAYFVPGGRFTAMAAPLKGLVQFAYQLRDHQVVGGPGWFDTEPFDISAKADGPASNDELRRMVQTLLAERFQLKFHRETKEQPVYALVVGKGGPKLQAAKSEGRGVGIGVRGRLNGNGADMKTLASVLADRLSRSVVDRTGLKGFYDFLLTWTPDEVQADDPGPSLSTAIQEQLGLKLESTKAPVEMIVIDHAEKPSNNFEPPAAEQEHALHNVAPQVAVAAKPQSQPAPPVGKPLAFEVASIRPSNSADRRTLLGGDAGRFTANNVTVKKLIENAYGIKDFQISGGPGWAASDLFDISAKSEDPLKPEDLWRAIQSLLADRFKLVIRRETKQMPVYALVVAKNGPKFKDVKASDPNIADPGGRSDLPSGVRPRFMIVRRGRFTGQGVDMETLAWRLSGFLGRTVLDKTGLKAQYDLKLEWVPDENQIAMFQAMGVPEGNGAPPPDWQGPTLFTALEEQLGLKLDSQKGPVEMFMIERVEKPSDNFEPPIAKQQQALDTIAPQMTVAAKP